MENDLRRGLRCGLRYDRHVALYPPPEVGGFTATSNKPKQKDQSIDWSVIVTKKFVKRK